MNITYGVVQSVGSKPVTTKFGTKPTYTFKVEGVWYKCGFKNPQVNVGDVVSFTSNSSTYGEEVDMTTFSKTAAGAGAPLPKAVGTAAPYTPSKGVFPVPVFDGQRSIIRQNALTNARELFASAAGNKPFAYSDDSALRIIEVARIFESYTTGDIDVEELQKEIAGEAV